MKNKTPFLRVALWAKLPWKRFVTKLSKFTFYSNKVNNIQKKSSFLRSDCFHPGDDYECRKMCCAEIISLHLERIDIFNHYDSNTNELLNYSDS